MIDYSKYKLTDRTAPRFRQCRFNLVSPKLYNKFLKENPNFYIDYKDFKFIISEINKEIINQVIENREGILLPKGLGRLWLGFFIPKRKVFSETGLLKYDFETGDLQGKILWDYKFTRYKIKSREFYGFHAHRDFKTLVSKAFKSTPERYSKIMSLTKNYEYLKRKKLEINEYNRSYDPSSDQPSEDSE